jgi:hypothetical protein
MEAAIRELMGAGTPPRFKFKDTYASIEFPTGYTIPAQATLEAKYNELLALEEDIQKTVIEGDLEVGTSNLFVDTETGNVGVGTTSPIAALDIDAGANDTTTPALAIRGGYYDTSDLYVLNTYNTNTGVGYAAKVIGVNIKNKVETDNTVQIRNNVGGLDTAGAIYLGSDDLNQGIFGVLGGVGATGTTLSEHLTVRAGGNVGIGKTNPAAKLDVNGTIQTPLLNVNGTTMSKAPRVIHIDDTRSGCPPTQAANTPIMQYSLTLSRTAYVYVSVTTILNYSARADCYIYFNDSVQQRHLTASDNTSWNPVNITAGGSLGAGTHTIKFMCNRANVVGCGEEWGGMQILVFEQ